MSAARSGLAMHDVTVTFGGLTALSDVSLRPDPHEVLGVIGPNGAGKTTLFNVACGFVVPDSGTLSWRGQELRRLRPHDLAGLGISRTLQGLGLFDRMTVLDNVLVGADRDATSGFWSDLLVPPPLRPRRGPAARPRARRRSTSSASRRTPTATPRASPTPCARRSPSPGPWSPSPSCCCSTSRRAGSPTPRWTSSAPCSAASPTGCP